ncbi:MAG: hypothetical protein ACK5JS_03550 [Mangrovibacterium sp.]
MFFVGFISTLLPQLLTVGMALVALHQIGNEVRLAAEDGFFLLKTQETISQEAEPNLTATYVLSHFIQDVEIIPEEDVKNITEFKEEKTTFCCEDINHYRLESPANHLGLSPPVFI